MTEMPSGPTSPPPTRIDAAAGKIDDVLHRAARSVRRALVWNRIYRTTSYLRSALWTIPLLAILLVLILAPGLRVLDAWLGWRLSGLGLSGAQALYQTTITLTLSFIVFTFGSLLVAIQVAGGQLTPRIIATTLLRDNVVRYSVGLFVFTLVFAVMALNRLDKTVYEIVSLITALLAIACMAMFLFLIDYAARLLRPVSILTRVGDEGAKVIMAVYTEPASAAPEVEKPFVAPEGRSRTVPHTGPSAIILAVDLDTLVADARRTDGLIELVPQVGDFVATGEPLLELYGNAVVALRSPRAVGGRARTGADAGAGSALCVSNHRRHRPQGAVAGNQRSDDWRARDRSAAPSLACRRQAPASRRDDCR